VQLAPGLLAIAAGVLLALSQPPVGWSLLAFLVPGVLAASIVAQHRQGRPAWRMGAMAALVGFGAMLSWLIAPAGYVAWIGLTLVQVFWWSLLGLVLDRWHDHPLLPVVGAVAWVGVDAWRGSLILGGFGWGSLATAQVGNGWLVPLARIAGGKAVTLAIVLVSLSIFEAIRRPIDATRDASGRIVWGRLRAALPAGRTAAAMLAGTMAVVTLATIEPPGPSGTADVVLVQANDVEQWTGTGLSLDEHIAQQALAQTREAIVADGVPDLVVWPESSIDRDPSRSPVLAQTLATGGRIADGRLLAGVSLDGPRAGTWLNTSVVVGADGQITDRYVKRHPVPFGEYVPLRSWLDWFPPLRQVPRDAIAGDEAAAVDVRGLHVAVAICFETMFSHLVASNVQAVDPPASLIVASTNDASFGRTGEPLQHLAQSRLRAIETGRWVVHAAISGRSAFVDPDGGVHQLTDLYTVDHRRMSVPLVEGRTPYLVTGDWLGLLSRVLLVAALLALAWERWRKRT
jgi:apolipoprotein N-acyltransferase